MFKKKKEPQNWRQSQKSQHIKLSIVL